MCIFVQQIEVGGWALQRKISVFSDGCTSCKQAVSSSRVYCCKLRKYVDDIVYCPDFEPEPLEYRLYRRM